MADEQKYAEIKEKFAGSWKLDRSENFEEFLREVGKLNVFTVYFLSTVISCFCVYAYIAHGWATCIWT